MTVYDLFRFYDGTDKIILSDVTAESGETDEIVNAEEIKDNQHKYSKYYVELWQIMKTTGYKKCIVVMYLYNN